MSLGALLMVLLVVLVRFYPDLKRWAAGTREPSAPLTVPGATTFEGPYFSDGGRVAERLVAAVNHTRATLDIAIYDLTHPEITAALDAAARRGVKIRLVADENQSHEMHSEIPYLRSKGLAVRLSRGYRGNRSIMHNKFAVFDRKMVETGSFNWTTSADGYNFENALFISNPTIVQRFEEEFERIWSQAKP